jgi:hypothetical protein
VTRTDKRDQEEIGLLCQLYTDNLLNAAAKDPKMEMAEIAPKVRAGKYGKG